MSRNGIRGGAIALTTVAFIGLASASAFAAPPARSLQSLQSPQSLATIQARAAAAITLRLDDLTTAIARVQATSGLGSSSASLVTYLQADIAPLQALSTKIARDTTVATALADSSTIFSSYRVLALVLPAARLAAGADDIDVTVIPDLTTFSTQAASHVNPANGAALQPLIDDLEAQIRSATDGTTNVASTLLGYTAPQWNADHDLLATSRGSVQAARDDVTKARSDVQQIRAILVPAAPSATTAPSASA
jgi:hypothetical protein